MQIIDYEQQAYASTTHQLLIFGACAYKECTEAAILNSRPHTFFVFR